MAKQIAKLLKASIQETSDLKEIAKMLAKKGRGGDTMLAHITPKEAAVLKESGGAGTVNPDTGLLEFYDGEDYGTSSYYTRPSSTFSTASVPIDYGFEPSGYAPTGTSSYTGGGARIPASQFMGDLVPPDSSYFPSSRGTPAISGVGDFEEFPEGMSAAASLPQTPAGVYGDGRLTSFYAPQTVGLSPYAEQPVFGAGGPGTQPAPAAPVAPERSALQRYIGDPLKQLKAETGITGADLARVGIAGAGAIAGYQQQKKAARQIEQAVAEQKALAEPYRQRGEELQRAAMAGEMTPQSAQAFQALRAQLAQGAEARGGVGAAQAAAQLEAFRTNLLQNQYDFGLKVSQIGDQVALGAIRTGMQLDQQLGQANQQFYGQLASIAAGGTYGYQPPRGQ